MKKFGFFLSLKLSLQIFLEKKIDQKKREEKTCWKFANLDSPLPPSSHFSSSKQFSFFSATKK
jgi:hypothetical protein